MSAKKEPKKTPQKAKEKPVSKPSPPTKKTAKPTSKKASKKVSAKKNTVTKDGPSAEVEKVITQNEVTHILDSTSGRIGVMIREIMLPILVPIAKELGPTILRNILDSAIRSAKSPTAKNGLLLTKRILLLFIQKEKI